MKLDEAVSIFKNLISRTDKKAEIKIYQKFIIALGDLRGKNLSEGQYQLIETELDSLIIESTPENKKKHYRRGFNKFMKFLDAEFSFIAEGYYTGIGMVLGMSFGVVMGSSIAGGSGSSMGISLGMMFGLLIGAAMDSKAKKQNRVIRTKLKKA
jgi:hypothetical protein